MQGKIIKRAVEALDEGLLWDTELKGFGVRCRGEGKVYLLKFRDARGRQRWHTIGRHGSPWTPELARREAMRLLVDIAAGKSLGTTSDSTTVSAAVEQFIEAHCQHLRTSDEYAWLLRHHVVSRWDKQRIGAIKKGDVAKLLRDVQGADSTKRIRIANRVRTALLRLFDWCCSEAIIDENPAANTDPRPGEVRRERVLSDAEIVAVWKAAGTGTFGAIVRLLLVTAQRRGEVGGMRWSELDLKEGEGEVAIEATATWTIPPERHKSGRGHAVPLTGSAIVILTGRRPDEETQGAVFCGEGFQGWGKAKKALDTASGVTGWRLHDIRRTVATQMQNLGIQPHVIAAVLGHSLTKLFGVTSIYMRSMLEQEKREALEAWEKHLLGLVAKNYKG